MIPSEHFENVIDHVVMAHNSVEEYSQTFLLKLRRSNYVTPKNYLDFINTYARLLNEKDQFILGRISSSKGE